MIRPRREKIVVGNWKMFKTSAEALAFMQELATLMHTSNKTYLAVPFTSLESVSATKSRLIIGAQTIHEKVEGSFTGEISARMVKAAGAQFVILGHSERRELFGENNSSINKKIKIALEHSLQPIVCIGERIKEREDGQTETFLAEQLKQTLQGLDSKQLAKCIIAYEPIWAIGTGKHASAQLAQSTLQFIREAIDPTVSKQMTLLYGGSVTPNNASLFMAEEDIDGLLVGSAALKASSFSQIINYHSTVSGA